LTIYASEKEVSKSKSKLRNDRFREMKGFIGKYAAYKAHLEFLVKESRKYYDYFNEEGLSQEEIENRLKILNDFESKLNFEEKNIMEWCHRS
jgi:hypothetical protein